MDFQGGSVSSTSGISMQNTEMKLIWGNRNNNSQDTGQGKIMGDAGHACDYLVTGTVASHKTV